MAVTTLTAEQEESIEQLAAAGRIEQVPADQARASAFLRQAEAYLADLGNVTVAQNRYSLSYSAGHAAGEALMAAHGYRQPTEQATMRR